MSEQNPISQPETPRPVIPLPYASMREDAPVFAEFLRPFWMFLIAYAAICCIEVLASLIGSFVAYPSLRMFTDRPSSVEFLLELGFSICGIRGAIAMLQEKRIGRVLLLVWAWGSIFLSALMTLDNIFRNAQPSSLSGPLRMLIVVSTFQTSIGMFACMPLITLFILRRATWSSN